MLPPSVLFILQAAWVLAVFVHPSHIVSYAPRDSLSCRLHATRIILCTYPGYLPKIACFYLLT
ncbi:hypothetical protein C9426_30640 [Serratia sp. S1B]|nr:hypothetical protein C9426_30640 [Serratia sp. S1B]